MKTLLLPTTVETLFWEMRKSFGKQKLRLRHGEQGATEAFAPRASGSLPRSSRRIGGRGIAL